MSTEPLKALLACPRCDRTPLDRTAGSWRCPACRVDYPSCDGIPWLFAEPKASLGEWRGKLHFALRRLEQDQARLAQALAAKSIRDTTRQRLGAKAAALTAHLGQLQALLAPLQLEQLATEQATYLALRTRLPSDQGLTTYYNNVHRDWAWGAEENRVSLEIVSQLANNSFSGRMLVLGAGAGRLAYDLHMGSKVDTTIVLDFNPLLLLLAQRLTRGESVDLYEFPIAPKSLREQAVLRTLRADEPARDGLYYVLADAHRPPFPNECFDTIITPWLIDILPERFDSLCKRINALLSANGRWINFGSLSFENADPALCYSREEALEMVAENGFAAPQTVETEIPYMCSPASRHGRRERILAWCAPKVSKAKKISRHEALPDWLVRGKDPVPASAAFKMQAMSTRIHAYIMSLIDGRRSIQDMAALLEEQRLMPREQAEPAIRAFLIKMHEDSQRM